MVLSHLDNEAPDKTGIITLGYEGRKLDQFLEILIGNNIKTLIDVRNNPFSMKPGFSKNQLSAALNTIGVTYLHLPELGIESCMRKNLTKETRCSLFQNYERDLDAKSALLDKIKELSKREIIALMCFEANVRDCHRGVIAKRLRDDGMNVIDL
jgi:uncharacterized protein (DUF488 family)